MLNKKFIYSLSIGLTAFFIGTNDAQAAYFTPQSSHSAEDIEEQIRNGSFVEEFNASSYIGDDGGAAYELEIVDIDPPANPIGGATGQYSWESGEEVGFKLSFDGTDLTYEVGGEIIESKNVTKDGLDINGMLLSTTSTENSSATLKDLMFEDGDFNYHEMFSGDSDADFLKITGIDNTFTLTGKQVFTWEGDRPENFDLAYKVRVGTFQDPMAASPLAQAEIPEPSTVSLFSLGVIALGLKRYRDRK